MLRDRWGRFIGSYLVKQLLAAGSYGLVLDAKRLQFREMHFFRGRSLVVNRVILNAESIAEAGRRFIGAGRGGREGQR